MCPRPAPSNAAVSASLARLQELEREFVMPTYPRLPVEFVRGEGCRLWDAEDTEYLDLFAGVAVAALGHSHPALVEAITRQAGRLLQVSNLFYTEPGIRLAERLSKRSLGGKVFFANSGAEANECAIKLARRHRPRGEVVVLTGAFHGRTMGSLSATPQETKQEPFAPLVPGFVVVPREDPDALVDAVHSGTAAVMLEPIQGESGVHLVAPEVVLAAREACDRHRALLVLDEVATGVGRTGTLWAWEQGGVRPDVMTLAKGLGGGVPIGACITAPEHGDLFRPGDHGSTFAGSPLAAAAASVVLETVDDEDFLGSVRASGEALAEGLRALAVENVRGAGLMLAFDVPDAPALVGRALAQHRLVINATGPHTIRLVPPLVLGLAEVEEALSRLVALLGSPARRPETLEPRSTRA